MKSRRVEFSEEATRDITDLYEWIARAAGSNTAASYLDRLEEYCRGFDVASERGQRRDDIRPGLRIVGFERRITLAFFVEDERVVFLRILYGGQNWEDIVGS